MNKVKYRIKLHNMFYAMILTMLTIACAEDKQYNIVEEGDPCFFEITNLSIWQNFDCHDNVLGVGNIESVENPMPSGLNTSKNVGAYNDDGTNGWDALIFDYGSPIDLSSKSTLKISVLSENPISILTKMEGGVAHEIWSPTVTVGEWTEYSFDYSASIGNGNTKLVLFFNAGNGDGTPNDIYYIDNIKWE